MGTGEKGDVAIDLVAENPTVIITGDLAVQLASLIGELPSCDHVPCEGEDGPDTPEYFDRVAGQLVARMGAVSVAATKRTEEAA